MRSHLGQIVSTSRRAFIAVACVSVVINVLMLTGPLYMMQVYDRVLTSHSVPTLLTISGIALLAFLFQGALEVVRTRILTLIGERFEAEIGPAIQRATIALPLVQPRSGRDAGYFFRHLEAIRNFMATPGPAAMFDLVFVPLYLAILYLIHPWLGHITVAGAVLLAILTALTELRSGHLTKKLTEQLGQRNAALEAAERGSEVVHAMGMRHAVSARWAEAHEAFVLAQRRQLDVVGGYGAASRTFRLILQSAVLGLGGYLAITGVMSPGAIIAASIIASRALSPVDQIIGSWRAFGAARLGYGLCARLLDQMPVAPERFALPRPQATLAVDSVAIAPPGSNRPVVRNIRFALKAGQALAIIGPSASGKSTLARALVGIWRPMAGRILLDGARLDFWEPEDLGPSIGYLPQDVQLFEGTIAQNIARFDASATSEAVIAAAGQAAFHEHVLAMSGGYDTPIGAGGVHLSTGQRQRLGLARALYGNPFLVVMDEPNANLDAEGEAAVTQAIINIRNRRGIAVIVAHRPSALQAVDMVLTMQNGEQGAFGPKEQVLQRTLRNAGDILRASGPAGLSVVTAAPPPKE